MRKFHSICTRAAAGAFFSALLVCSAFPARAQDNGYGERTVTVHGAERSYLVHVPSNARSPAPVVFVFHGGGGRPEAIERKTGMDDVADQNGFIVVYPAGGQGSGRGATWNVGDGRTGSSSDVAFVEAILRDLNRTSPIDNGRIYAAGLSIGGVFSYRLACEMSGTFAAIAPVAATMIEPSCHPRSPVAILHIHGADDDRIPLNGGRGDRTAADRTWPAPQRGISSWSKFDGCSGAPTSSDNGSENCTTYGQCSATVEFCVVAGAGHAWPGGASEEIWAFFAAHPKAR